MAERVADALRPPRAFDSAARMVVDYLDAVAPMGAWAVTRVADDHQTVLVSTDREYGFVQPGTDFEWRETFCRPMVAGAIPRLVPDTGAEPALAEPLAKITAQGVDIGSYVGTPIVRPDGSLFGTVCGFRPDPGLPTGLLGGGALLDLLSSMLSAVLEADTAATEAARALERAVEDSESDVLTGLLNRRGWDRWVAREEKRFRRFGDPASVIMLDLDRLKRINDTEGHAAGDRHIQAAARALRAGVRDDDVVARLGGDEFALVVRTGADDALTVVDRLEAALDAAGVLGSFGCAPYSVVTGFPGAVADADAAMYRSKQLRRAARR